MSRTTGSFIWFLPRWFASVRYMDKLFKFSFYFPQGFPPRMRIFKHPSESHRGFLEYDFLGLQPRASESEACESALPRSQAMLILLIWGPHFENHCPRTLEESLSYGKYSYVMYSAWPWSSWTSSSGIPDATPFLDHQPDLGFSNHGVFPWLCLKISKSLKRKNLPSLLSLSGCFSSSNTGHIVFKDSGRGVRMKSSQANFITYWLCDLRQMISFFCAQFSHL